MLGITLNKKAPRTLYQIRIDNNARIRFKYNSHNAVSLQKSHKILKINYSIQALFLPVKDTQVQNSFSSKIDSSMIYAFP